MSMWVFGYGSLLWNPGFAYQHHKLARLNGYRRSFCMSSIHHRGTKDAPGLVLALDKSESSACYGLAFYVRRKDEQDTLAYLRERELISSAYMEVFVELIDKEGVKETAIAYIIDQSHVQYCAGLPLEQQANIISSAVGERGPNAEYLFNTVAKLKSLDISDDELEWLEADVRRILDAK